MFYVVLYFFIWNCFSFNRMIFIPFINISNLTVITSIGAVKMFAVHTEGLSKSSDKKQQSAYYCYSKRKLIVSAAFLRSSVMFIALNRNGINLKIQFARKVPRKHAFNYIFTLFESDLFFLQEGNSYDFTMTAIHPYHEFKQFHCNYKHWRSKIYLRFT